MDDLHLAVQLYTLREHLKTPERIEATLRRVRGLGYRSVQVSGVGPIRPERLQAIVAELGLSICATHTPFERLRNDLPAVIEEHRLWDCRHVGLGAMPQEYRGSREGLRRFAADVAPIARTLREAGLRFVYHNHHFEFERFDGVSGMEYLLESTDPQDFGFLLDTYWVQAAGADPAAWVRRVAGRMDVVHLKDMAVVGGQAVFAEVGSGNLDWDGILAACRETGVTWYAVEQDDCIGDPFESVAKSRAYLAKRFR